jgi:hypothetical protein
LEVVKMGALEDMTNLIPVVAAGGVLSKMTDTMFNQAQRPAPRKAVLRPVAPRPGKVVRKLQGVEATKFHRINRAGEVKAKAFGIKPVGFGQAWNGDFSNIGF